jgi:hypothetical protein
MTVLLAHTAVASAATSSTVFTSTRSLWNFASIKIVTR